MSTLSLPSGAALLRRARRMALRSPARTAWTGLLVAAAVTAAVVLMAVSWGRHVRTNDAARDFGAADAIYSGSGSTADAVANASDAVGVAVPDGSTVAFEETVPGIVFRDASSDATADSASTGAVHMADWEDPLNAGVLDLVEGRKPGEGQVVLSPTMAARTGLGVGDDLGVVGSDETLEVVGIASIGKWGDDGVATVPGQLVPVGGGGTAVDLTYRVGLPEGATARQLGPVVGGDGSATFVVDGPRLPDRSTRGIAGVYISGSDVPLSSLVLLLVGAVGAVGILAGAAFGIGASRRTRAAGLLAACGADRTQLAAASASEALVVAAPAAALGAALAWAVPSVWVSVRLPGWAAMVDAVMPWAWVAVTVLASVVAAMAGTVLFSRSLRSASTVALLDGRAGPRHRSSARPIGALGWIGIALLGYLVLSAVVGVASRWYAVSSLATIAIALLWVACGLGALRLLRVVLRRGPIGRLVERDLRRHRIGSIAAVVVVATWSFVAVVATATGWFQSLSVNDGRAFDSASVIQRDGRTTTFVNGGGPTTSVGGATDADLPEADTPAPVAGGTTAMITSPGASGPQSSSSGWVVRGSSVPTTPQPAADRSFPDGVAADLLDAGLATQSAVVGRWTGPCPVCPSGFVPNVVVLDSARGIGLAPATVDLLESGAAVTPFAVEGVEGQTVAGLPVRVGEVPSGVQAAVLRSAVIDGANLTDVQPALVGDAAGLTPAQSDDVVEVVRSATLQLDTTSPVLSADWMIDGLGSQPVDQPDDRVVWPWLILLVAVTLVATAAHRREHADASRVLGVLGAGPRAGRNLASVTAGSLAGVGVVLGLGAASVLIALTAARRLGGGGLVGAFDGLWNRQATLVLLAALAVPVVVAALARLIPPSRAGDGPDGPMPA